MKRCTWVEGQPEIYLNYHDNEWGVPVYDDHKLYEMLFLECFQAGLSWLTVLKKRENFRSAFDQFDPTKIQHYNETKVEELLQDPGIIRSRSKINAAINNAAKFIEIQQEHGSFSKYLWGFSDGTVIVNKDDQFTTTTDLSDALSKDLKKRGMKYVGSVTIYAYLQGGGVVNDHELGCFRHPDK
ncbi:3-methyladenine DNA glycosylase [Pontibacillus halophilus JSM 076056 = DSM 19796]|uniref:3-methyladenine DNA glycosylase n=1 Tax=Pontibacillus halophilus JSM 076056 = DSM 19796 TaxID=1385510 RepID=A0A0A5G9F2_9BACI|nr:DNA-3-methyladenine glycosylase I [Pontibacillus halophilus]KGX88664.1 3-methyladenine DNA glycosylase [Pontibacillus halophilus JSM 076056 = DSM 19796]